MDARLTHSRGSPIAQPGLSKGDITKFEGYFIAENSDGRIYTSSTLYSPLTF